jgi:hypothetical protein
MGKKYGTHGRDNKFIRKLRRKKLQGRYQLGGLTVNWRITLKLIVWCK